MEKITPLTLRHRLGLEIARKLRQEQIKEHPLRQLFWECTLRCNLHCRHCGSDCKKEAGFADMPLKDFLRVLDQVAERTDPHKVFVILTGGEPLVREDLEVCGRAIYDRGFPWGLVTNGLYLTRDRLNRLRATGLHTATVSLDGQEAEHNWMRGHRESFARALDAIRFLVDATDVVFAIFPSGRAVKDPALQLTGEEFRRLMEFIRTTRKEGRIHLSYGCEGFLGNYEGEVRDQLFFCQAGVVVGSVLIDGSISACPSIRADYHQGNIYQDNFMDVWEQHFHPYRDREWMRTGDCATCKYFRYCLGNGMHLRDGEGKLMFCHLKRLEDKV